jgi:dTDP-4-dehydrorhamnose 3,5-epimerase
MNNINLEEPKIIQPNIFHDERGWFYEAFSTKMDFTHTSFVQDNHSLSLLKGTLRGLHLQLPPYEQAKIVRVLKGRILDVIVDLRKSSSTYLKTFKFFLDDVEKKSLYIPRGFAHGFITLDDATEVYYKVDNYYSKEHELTLSFDDPQLAIDWTIEQNQIIVSEKDKKGLSLSEVISLLKEAK